MDTKTTTNDIIHTQLGQIKSFNNHHKIWAMIGVGVTVVIIGIIFEWNNIQSNRIIWVLISAGLIISCIWWWWVLHLVKLLLDFRMVENAILLDLISDFQEDQKEDEIAD